MTKASLVKLTHFKIWVTFLPCQMNWILSFSCGQGVIRPFNVMPSAAITAV